METGTSDSCLDAAEDGDVDLRLLPQSHGQGAEDLTLKPEGYLSAVKNSHGDSIRAKDPLSIEFPPPPRA